MCIQLFKVIFITQAVIPRIFIAFLLFLFMLPVYAKPNDSVQLKLDGYDNYEEAFDVAIELKKQGLIKQINVQGNLLNSQWNYFIVVAEDISLNSAAKITDNLNKLSYQNTSLDIINNESSLNENNSLSLEEKFKISEVANDDSSEEIILLAQVDKENLGNSNSLSILEDELKSADIEWSGSFQVEQEVFTRSESSIDQLQYLHIDTTADWHINDEWQLKAGLRVDGNYQHGSHTSSNDTKLDYTDSYLRYRNENYRFTLGAQTPRWGRMDSFSPTDKLSVVDLSRGFLPELGENYRSIGAIRAELFFDQNTVDIVYIPKFRAAELAEEDQVWFPINFYNGQVLGFAKDPLMSTIIKNTDINDNFSREDGFGVRYGSSINSIDFSISAQYVQLSSPYYHYDDQFANMMNNPTPQSIAALQSGNLARFTIFEEHPENLVIGADVEFEWKEMTWRFESAWLSDLPATTSSLLYKTYEGIEWAGGMEFYPGDSDTRVNMQLSGKHIFNKEKIVDRDNILSLSGEIESEFNNGKWILNTRYNLGLDLKDIYIAPEISYRGWEPYELYTSFHYFDGAEQSIGGFYENNKMLNFGLRVKN